MNARLKYCARRALAGAIVCACALMVLPAPLFAAEFRCKATEAAVLFGLALNDNRIHVRCAQAVPGTNIEYFAYRLRVAGDDGTVKAVERRPDVDRLLSLATTAVVTHRVLLIVYDPNDRSMAPSCQESNCRPIQGMILLN